MEERQVGTWDITPTADGVVAQNERRAVIPEGIKAQMKRGGRADG